MHNPVRGIRLHEVAAHARMAVKITYCPENLYDERPWIKYATYRGGKDLSPVRAPSSLRMSNARIIRNQTDRTYKIFMAL